MSTYPYPAKDTAFRALLVAPILPVGLFFLFDALDRVVQFGFAYVAGAALLAFYVLIFVEIFSLVFGGIALAVLWKRIPFNFIICSLMGGVVASLPFVMFGLLGANSQPINYDAWSNGEQTVIDGVSTPYGHWQDFVAIAQIFGLGIVGGGFFWWLCRPKAEAETQ